MKKIYLLVMLALVLNAEAIKENFILNSSGLIDKRAYIKINEIGKEVKNKIHVNIYLDVKGNNGIDMSLPMKERVELTKEKEKITTKNLAEPYVLLAISLDQKYANILYSESLKTIINKDDTLDGYVIPLLAAKDKNLLKSKVSAAVLNGYAQIGDQLAENKNIKLISSIGSEGKTAGTIWKMFMYTMVLIGIISYFFIILKEKKYKKEKNE